MNAEEEEVGDDLSREKLPSWNPVQESYDETWPWEVPLEARLPLLDR